MLYICIHDDKTIEYAEEWPTSTDEEKDWATRNADRLALECMARGSASGFVPYSSEEKQFTFSLTE